jgi:hypothetical protein
MKISKWRVSIKNQNGEVLNSKIPIATVPCNSNPPSFPMFQNRKWSIWSRVTKTHILYTVEKITERKTQ